MHSNQEEMAQKKDKNSTQKGKTGDDENLEGNYQFLLGSKIVSLKPTKEKRWVCPFCHEDQKQIMRHIKSKHLTSSQMEGFADTEKDFKKHLDRKRVQAYQKIQKKIDEKGFKERITKAVLACQKRQKRVDERGFNKRHAKSKQASRKRQKEVDEEGFKQQTTKASQAYQKRQLGNDEAGFRKKQKLANEKNKIRIRGSLEGSVKRFHQEILYGPAFVCVCCRTMNFRHNVVEYSKTTQTNIRRKADEVHAKDYNSRIQQVHGLFVLTFLKLLFCLSSVRNQEKTLRSKFL